MLSVSGVEPEGPERVLRRRANPNESAHAMRSWWDSQAPEYYQEHGEFLGDDDFVWGPENLRESSARLLGDVAGQQVLEVGCGAAQCSRWLMRQGAHPVAFDLSGGQLAQGRALNARTGVVPLVQADAQRLPFADASFDLACSAYGAIPFVADSAAVMRELARGVLPCGLRVISTTPPLRRVLLAHRVQAG